MAIIGNVIEGKYEILTMIGRGGMSEVYLAMDKNLNKQWAVKEIKKRTRDKSKNNEVVIQSAIAEANMMKRLDHPCLPRIVDIIDREDVIYVIMDYIEGEPLSKVLERHGAQNQETVIEWAKDLCGVLDYLHSQNPPIIYRDMKPANIMLQPNGNIKLIDFGIAREYKAQNLEDTVSLGTKGYAAPEQFGGKGQTDARTDIYCLGVTLYHLVTGKNPCEPPYELYPIRYWNPELSSGLESIILKCTALNPEDRYQSCAELMYALMHYEEADESYRKKQKRKLRRFYGMVAMTVLFSGAGIGCQIGNSFNDKRDYDNYIKTAEKLTDTEQKVANYRAAIEINAKDMRAYQGLIETFKTNPESFGEYTPEEKEILEGFVTANQAVLREQADYGELCFDLGRLCWFYYTYGNENNDNNDITRMTSAIIWFSDAVDYAAEGADYVTRAKAYMEIGAFYRDVTLKVAEAGDKGSYKDLYDNLSELVQLVDEDGTDLTNLEVYRVCIFSVENYARNMRRDGIEQAELEQFVAGVLQKTNQITTAEGDKADAVKVEILERETSVKEAIANAYQN